MKPSWVFLTRVKLQEIFSKKIISKGHIDHVNPEGKKNEEKKLRIQKYN